MAEEKWLPIRGYVSLYEISVHGSVRSLDRVITLQNGSTRNIKGKILSQKKNGKGYGFVALSKDGATKTHYIHRLLGFSFIEQEANKPFINHRDGNPANNALSNLEWVSHAENVFHAYDTGLNNNKAGNHSFAVGVIDNELGLQFDTVKEWAAARGINYSTGRNILSGCNTSKTIDLTKIYKQLKMKIKND
jgi:hypothetical protein